VADPNRYGLPRNVGIKLNDKDINRAKELMKCKCFQKRVAERKKKDAHERTQIGARRPH
jgi:DNA topoisomerase-6 subunit A